MKFTRIKQCVQILGCFLTVRNKDESLSGSNGSAVELKRSWLIRSFAVDDKLSSSFVIKKYSHHVTLGKS